MTISATSMFRPIASTSPVDNVCAMSEPPASPRHFRRPFDYGGLYRAIGLKIGRKAFQVARDPAAVRAKQSREPNMRGSCFRCPSIASLRSGDKCAKKAI